MQLYTAVSAASVQLLVTAHMIAIAYCISSNLFEHHMHVHPLLHVTCRTHHNLSSARLMTDDLKTLNMWIGGEYVPQAVAPGIM